MDYRTKEILENSGIYFKLNAVDISKRACLPKPGKISVCVCSWQTFAQHTNLMKPYTKLEVSVEYLITELAMSFIEYKVYLVCN